MSAIEKTSKDALTADKDGAMKKNLVKVGRLFLTFASFRK